MICAYIVLISVSANTQGYNIGIVSEVKKLYRDIPTLKARPAILISFEKTVI